MTTKWRLIGRTGRSTLASVAVAAGVGLLLSGAVVQAGTDTFTGFTMDFVDVGDAGNLADDTTYGAVSYDYQMGVHEVSEAMIAAYNTNSGGPTITMDTRGPNKPATSVNWNEAARFVNWLNADKGYAVAYKFAPGGGANDNIELWTGGDAGFDAGNPFRNSNAHYYLPSEDEWYKAAYYDPNTSMYNDYATGSDSAPTAVASGMASGAVYDQSFATGPADVTNAGGSSSYGTMAQNGNVWEWGESAFNVPNDSAGESRMIRGGSWFNNSTSLQSSTRSSSDAGPPFGGASTIGFRVAAVPEPSSVSLLLIGAIGLLMKRKRC